MKEYNIGQQVSFAKALGYGVSTLLNWIAYITVICILDAIMFAIVIVSESIILALIAGFIMFVLTTSLFIAIGYKSLSDIGMKAASTIEVENAAFPSLTDSHTHIFSQETKIDQQEVEKAKIECPDCGKIFSVNKRGQLQDVKCRFCGQEGKIEI